MCKRRNKIKGKNMKREKFIDIARGIAIILVVCGHCDNFLTWSIEDFSNLFFMPLFIFISGYLFKNRSITNIKELFEFLKKRVLPIYLYYLKYEVLFYLLNNVFFKVGFYSSEVLYGDKTLYPITSLKTAVINIVKIIFGMGREPFLVAFWFLISLIFISIGYSTINYISSKLSKKMKQTYIINVLVIFTFALGCIMRYTINIPRFSPSLTLILFYHLGNLYYINREKIKFDNTAIALTSVILLLILNNFGSIRMIKNLFTNPLYLLICSMCGIYFVIYISKVIENNTKKIPNLLAYIGKNTLPIMAWHMISFKLAMLIQIYTRSITYSDLALLNGCNNNNLWYVLYVFFGVTIPLIINIIIEKIKKEIRIYKVATKN